VILHPRSIHGIFYPCFPVWWTRSRPRLCSPDGRRRRLRAFVPCCGCSAIAYVHAPILGARAARSGAAVAATTSAETKVGLCMRAIARGVVLVNTRYSAEPRRMASARFHHGAHVVLADFKNHGLLAALIVGESTVK